MQPFMHFVCFRMLRELQESFDGAERLTKVERDRLEKKLQKLEEANGMQLDTLQREAVIGAIENGVFILSGGPGTGKTTTINLILDIIKRDS